ncbi:MAG TPA: Maf family protein [Phycisphaerales bacterium]|nr:Maf family protein [Phycisphaerales bacterium]HMP35950.1 Maf family protein [Phycisphaerales bacterium]
MSARRFILASASPRRRALLRAAGIAADVMPADLDDTTVPWRGAAPAAWAMAMAWFKARRVASALRMRGELGAGDAGEVAEPPGALWIIAADTLCDLDGGIIGKPADEEACRATLRAFRSRAHRVHTGVALFEPKRSRRHVIVDSSTVLLGDLDDRAIEEYVAEGAWRGKAGGYNFDERVAAGWPLRCLGDPTTVTGLPMRLLARTLAADAPSEAA